MGGLDKTYVEQMARAALDEDAAGSDATVEFLQVGSKRVCAEIVAGQSAVVAGLAVAETVFRLLDTAVEVSRGVNDGDGVGDGDVLMRIDGSAGAVLGGERVALNFLQRLSGVATMASTLVERVRGTGVTILDTRKTTPLWRDLEKYAVRCGGAQNHRRDLSDMVLIKENHVRAMGGRNVLVEFLARGAGRAGAVVEVEVDSLEFLQSILGLDVNRVMLDNFSPLQVRDALKLIAGQCQGGARKPFQLEVSGGINADNIAEFALPGVDFISVGALTHSAPSVAMSLEVI